MDNKEASHAIDALTPAASSSDHSISTPQKMDNQEASEAIDALSLTASSSTPSTSASQMTLEEKFKIVRSIGEECIEEKELMDLLAKKPQPVCYDGFEPSGRMHIAQGVLKALNVNKLTSAGCKVKIWIADWFAQLNNKMGGDLKKIEVVGQYLIEIWKAVGMNLEGDQVEFLWSSKEINSRAHEYWPLVMDIARRNKLPRITRCCQIMGRSNQDELTAAQIFYPCMQCADIFFLKAWTSERLMYLQESTVMTSREKTSLSYCPIEGQEKMSKSDPSSSIYMEDEEAEVNVKVKKAFCPPKVVEKNPCLEYIKYIVLPWFNEFKIERSAENGGDKNYKNFEELAADYESGSLHPADLKPALSKAVNKILQPVRDHFKNDQKAKDLMKRVKSFKVTR
ncbi:tyrosine--tRNA ligase 1, cytoplasmic-like isoform X2 [Solanum dulcamara]|uniref:tyrosine--tRNA ligase 1, cytoplasmic-like isoform X2 n=1 Tax=Solanum dulcamara TaxID=45834 RepID=UPI002485B4AE|nr:tyrosine--tRNA ligase 1, cytoplasmic-like isoform X2 [Solanum dulcamara]